MRKEIETLTALRGVVALWVVLFHFWDNVAWPGAQTPGLIAQGSLAVDVFFVLSGFVMVYAYGSRFNVADFLAKRVARLYPVHLITLLGALSLYLGAQLLGISVRASVDLHVVLVHLFALHSLGFDGMAVLNYPSWSISAEFVAYLAFPVLVPLVLTRDLRIVIPAVLGFFISCVLIAEATGRAMLERTTDFSPLRILPEFLLGMLAARLCLEKRVSAPLTAGLGAGLILWGLVTHTGLLAVLGIPFMIAALYLYDRPVPRGLRRLGVISYSLYMVHALVENAGFTLFEIALDQTVAPFWTLPVLTVVAVLAANLLHDYVERPGQRLVLSLRQHTLRRV